MYNEKDDQIFIKLRNNDEPVEFLLTQQPLDVIKGGYANKTMIREVVETGTESQTDKYIKAIPHNYLTLAIIVTVHIDDILRVIEEVEVHIL